MENRQGPGVGVGCVESAMGTGPAFLRRGGAFPPSPRGAGRGAGGEGPAGPGGGPKTPQRDPPLVGKGRGEGGLSVLSVVLGLDRIFERADPVDRRRGRRRRA